MRPALAVFAGSAGVLVLHQAGVTLNDVKIVGVLRYVYRLSRDLLQSENLSADNKDYVRRLLAVVWPGFIVRRRDGKGRGYWYVLGLALSALLRTLLVAKSTVLLHRLTLLAYGPGLGGLTRGTMLLAGGLVAGGAAVTALSAFFKDALANVWRRALTERLHERYFAAMNFYQLANLPGRAAVHDPDERMVKEVTGVAQRLSTLVALLIEALPPIVYCTFRLYRSRGAKTALLPHLHLLIAYEIAQRIFPKNIGDLHRQHSAAKSAFVAGTTRVTTHCETIAALNGNPLEQKILLKKFDKTNEKSTELAWVSAKFGFIFKLAYIYSARAWLLSFIMLPFVRRGAGLAVSSVNAEVAAVRFTWQLVIEMLVANGRLLTLHAMSQHMIGLCKRVCDLMDSLDAVDKSRQQQASSSVAVGDCIAFEHVDVHTPTGHLLVRDLSFSLSSGGDSLLLTGHNGAGKSSIFRCLGGLWPVKSGVVRKPAEVFYIPQKPYNVVGTLADQIAYPSPGSTLPAAELARLVALVDLVAVFKAHAPAAVVNWQECLSLGEQQRVSIARLLFQKPVFAVLDECTSALTTDMESFLYNECIWRQISFVTICHRPALMKFHARNLNLTGDGKGSWELVTLSPPQQPRLLAAAAIDPCTLPTVVPGEKDSVSALTPSAHIHRRSAWSKLALLARLISPGSGRQVSLLLSMIVTRTFCHEMYSTIVGKLFKIMSDRDMHGFVRFSLLNVAQDLLTAVVDESATLLQNLVANQWTATLSHTLIGRIFANNALYRARYLDARIVDPEQRVSQETQELSSHITAIFSSAVTPVIDLVWFSWRLARAVGSRSLAVAWLYAAAVGVVVHAVLPDHDALNSRERQLESAFRLVHARLHAHAEAVAFFGGGPRERAAADKALHALIQQSMRVRRSDLWYKAVVGCISKDHDATSGGLVAVPDLVSLWLQHQCARTLSGSQLAEQGFVLQVSADRILRAFSKIADLYKDLSKLLGSSTRVCELVDVLDSLDTAPVAVITSSTNRDIVLANVDIVTPTGIPLATGLNVTIQPHHDHIVTGPNGAGKTSFFRVLAGLWVTKRGSVSRPAAAGAIMLVPQRTYAVDGSLRDQVTYPARLMAAMPADDLAVLDALRTVGIAGLVDREGGMATVKPWDDVLSLGEQQRLGLARVLYHRPEYVVIDEATDAVSASGEADLYRAIHAAGITCITISKRVTLPDMPQTELRLGLPAAPGWQLFPVALDTSTATLQTPHNGGFDDKLGHVDMDVADNVPSQTAVVLAEASLAEPKGAVAFADAPADPSEDSGPDSADSTDGMPDLSCAVFPDIDDGEDVRDLGLGAFADASQPTVAGGSATRANGGLPPGATAPSSTRA